jgi:hypothetical protein
LAFAFYVSTTPPRFGASVSHALALCLARVTLSIDRLQIRQRVCPALRLRYDVVAFMRNCYAPFAAAVDALASPLVALHHLVAQLLPL